MKDLCESFTQLSSLAVLHVYILCNVAVNAPLVDLTDDDGKPPSSNVADSREVTFNKLSGKTFPSLVVVARPHLRVKEMAQGTVSQERAALGKFFVIMYIKVTILLSDILLLSVAV